MSGPPHGFPSSFANAQQAAMRNQFVGGPGGQMPGLMAPAQQPGEFCPPKTQCGTKPNALLKSHRFNNTDSTPSKIL